MVLAYIICGVAILLQLFTAFFLSPIATNGHFTRQEKMAAKTVKNLVSIGSYLLFLLAILLISLNFLQSLNMVIPSILAN